jgi:hypothetical protein
MIDRQTTIPLVLGALVTTLAVAFVTHGIAVNEFTWAVPTRSMNPEHMPAITASFRHLHHVWWLLPSAAAVLALPLVSRRSCPAKYVTWFLSVVAVACVLWGLFFGLAMYLVRTTFVCGK